MKKPIYLVIVCVVFFACNQSSNKTEVKDHGIDEHAAITDMELSLNNGNKWKADLITNNNVAGLKTIIDKFKIKTLPSVTDYQFLGTDLNSGLNKMIQECRMKGPDHDALHKWLEPVLKGSYQLKTISDTAVARKFFNSIDERINAYYNYFEEI